MRILLADDDASYRDWLASLLRQSQLTVDVFASTRDLHRELPKAGDVLVVLGLPAHGIDSAHLIGQVIKGRPCVVLSSNDRDAERVAALEVGADDVIHKSTQPREIVARVNAVIRRSRRSGTTGQDGRGLDGWHFDPLKRELFSPAKTPVALTAAEFALLDHFVKNEGIPVGRDELVKVVFSRPFDPRDRAIDTLVVKLRRKLGETWRGGNMISTVRLRGYLFHGFAQRGQNGRNPPPGD